MFDGHPGRRPGPKNMPAMETDTVKVFDKNWEDEGALTRKGPIVVDDQDCVRKEAEWTNKNSDAQKGEPETISSQPLKQFTRRTTSNQ